jgi:8-oxo-dGTP pyrophosphatase MutT (NUDIX family)
MQWRCGGLVRDHVRQRVQAHTPREIPLEGLRDSAVLLLLHDEGGVEYLLFQVRASTLALHSGEIGFPGGRRHPADESLMHTALREVEEEIGVPPAHVEVFGQLDDELTHSSNYRIRPYAGAVALGPRTFATDPGEVQALLPIPVTYLRSSESRGWFPVEREGVVEQSPAFVYERHIIWGATARLLEHFLAVTGEDV